MARNTIYVGLRPEGGWRAWWKDQPVLSNFNTQKPALDYAVAAAHANQPSEVMLQRTDGEWENYATYGDDPFPPRG